MSFLDEMHKPDILDCIANLSNDEVFTSPRLANEILDTLPQELFKSSKTKFLDPCCKSGVFLREIAKRLIEGLKNEIPDLQERLDHIFKEQLYGLAITELTALLSRRSVYCSKDAGGEYAITRFDDKDGNIEHKKTYHLWYQDKCMMCGASKSEYDRGEELETHAYSFIHTDAQRNSDLFRRLKDMKFDVIIGNPPYQLSNGCFGAGASPLYHYFVRQAKKLNPRYITMIVPARWYAGGRGLDSFRDEMLHDDRIRVIHDFLDAGECFPGVEIKGGVCYFLWDRDNSGLCQINTHKCNEIVSSTERPLLEDGCNTFVRFNEAISVLKKVKKFKETTIDTLMSGQTPFGLNSNFEDFSEVKNDDKNIKLFLRGSVGYVSLKQILTNHDLVSKHKILVPKAWGNGSSGNTPDIIKPIYAEPFSACTQTYIVVGAFDAEQMALNYKSYLATNFSHFLISLRKNTQDAMRGVYSFVPIQDFNEEWTDEKLYKKYGLTQDEINFIESMIRPMG